jgi:acyl carrier protein
VLFLEKEFGVKVARADISGENFRDIESLSRFVEGRSRGDAAP